MLVQTALYRWRLDDVLTAVLDLYAQAGLLRRSSMGFALYGAGLIALILLALFMLLSGRDHGFRARYPLRRAAAAVPLVGATAGTIAVYVDTTVFKDHGVHFYEFDVVGMLSNAWLASDLGIRPQDLGVALAVAGATLVLEAALFVGLHRGACSRPWIGRWSTCGIVLCTGAGLGLYGFSTPQVGEERGELLESLPLRPVLLLEERTRPHIEVVPKLGARGYPTPGADVHIPRVAQPRNVIFLLGDGLRADHVTPELTPNLVAFAARPDVIAPERAFSTGHATEIGLFGLLYGLDAYHYHPFALASVPPFPLEVLRASGYVTAFVSGSRLNKYPTDFMAESFDRIYYPDDDDEIVPIIERFLAERRADGRPYFLLLFFYTPHYPFNTVDPENRRFQPSLIEEERSTFLAFDDPRFQVRARNSYKNSVIQADAYFARAFELVRSEYESGRTALVATSDHGTEFWEHGLFGHGRSTFWKEKVEVPLLVGLGGDAALPDAVRRPALASLKDVWPTMMERLTPALAREPARWSDGIPLASTPPEQIAGRTDLFVAGRYFPWADRPNLMVAAGRKHWLRVSGSPDGRLLGESMRTTDMLDRPVASEHALPASELVAGLSQHFWRFLEPAKGGHAPTFAGRGRAEADSSAGTGTGWPGSPVDAPRRRAPDILLTVDVEPDCLPYLGGWRGLEEGLPRLLDLFAEERVPATLFTTGEAAERYSWELRAAVAAGHELGCHGDTHERFGTMEASAARDELARASEALRRIAPATAFRAPYLDFPERFLPLLVEAGYRIDSSEGAHRISHRALAARRAGEASCGILRVRASTTSSALRLPAPLRDPWLARLPRPAVLFVHPWDLVDLRAAPIPWHCRLGTGARALDALREVIRLFRGRGARFGTMGELVA